MRKQVEFKELETGEFFECYGDIHLKYNTRKLCKCVKLDKITGKEINGIIFNIREIDTVFRLKNEPDNNDVIRIQDFPGVKLLVNEHGFITKEKLNTAIRDWAELQFNADFTEWCDKQLNKDV
jgi:hypothetical protein